MQEETSEFDSERFFPRAWGFVFLGLYLCGMAWWAHRRAKVTTSTPDSELDEALEETFPASDPIGHY